MADLESKDNHDRDSRLVKDYDRLPVQARSQARHGRCLVSCQKLRTRQLFRLSEIRFIGKRVGQI